MTNDGKLSGDRQHFLATHKRWRGKSPPNRDTASEDYKDEWYTQQCYDCLYYVKLIGEFGLDYGVCSSGQSEFDGRVMFEHDGCDNHVQDEATD